MARSNSEGSIHVLDKAFAILDVLAQRRELTVAEIADATGEPRSSVYRLIAGLELREMVERGGRRGTFRLGLAPLRLGSAVIARFDERQASLPAMEQLQRETGETVFLCVPRGAEAVCIERIEGERVQSLALQLGGSLPLHVGAAPRVLLAFRPEDEWSRYAKANDLVALTPQTPTTGASLTKELRTIRESGYAVSDEDVTPGIAAVGAPVFNHDGVVCAALSMSGTKPAILDDADSSISAVLRAAGEASRALGYRGEADG